jgi:hypothetical protein
MKNCVSVAVAALVWCFGVRAAYSDPGTSESFDSFMINFNQSKDASIATWNLVSSSYNMPYSESGVIGSDDYLTYALPLFGGVSNGDVGIYGYGSNQLVAGLYFYTPPTGEGYSFMEYYLPKGGGAPADTGFPPGFNDHGFTTTANSNGTFTFDTGSNVYIGSGVPGVPEPSSMIGCSGLILMGLIGLASRIRRR